MRQIISDASMACAVSMCYCAVVSENIWNKLHNIGFIFLIVVDAYILTTA